MKWELPELYEVCLISVISHLSEDEENIKDMDIKSKERMARFVSMLKLNVIKTNRMIRLYNSFMAGDISEDELFELIAD